jgi:hypothetical protein
LTGIHRIVVDLDRSLDAFPLALDVALFLHDLGELQAGVRRILQKILGSAQGRLSLVELFLCELSDSKPEPILSVGAHGNDLGQHFLRLLGASVLQKLLSEDATATDVFGGFVPVLLQATQQVFEPDRDRPPLLVLNLHGGTIEA